MERDPEFPLMKWGPHGVCVFRTQGWAWHRQAVLPCVALSAWCAVESGMCAAIAPVQAFGGRWIEDEQSQKSDPWGTGVLVLLGAASVHCWHLPVFVVPSLSLLLHFVWALSAPVWIPVESGRTTGAPLFPPSPLHLMRACSCLPAPPTKPPCLDHVLQR